MAGPPDPSLDDTSWPPALKRLRALVTVLTVVMIAGVIAITGLLVIRLTAETEATLVLPEVFTMPEGVNILGYNLVGDRAILVGDDNLIRIFAIDGGDPLQVIEID